MKKAFALTSTILATTLMLSGCVFLGFVPDDEGSDETGTSSEQVDTSTDNSLWLDSGKSASELEADLGYFFDDMPEDWPYPAIISAHYIKSSYKTNFTNDKENSWGVDLVTKDRTTTMKDLDERMRDRGWRMLEKGDSKTPAVWNNGEYTVSVLIIDNSLDAQGWMTWRYIITQPKAVAER